MHGFHFPSYFLRLCPLSLKNGGNWEAREQRLRDARLDLRSVTLSASQFCAYVSVYSHVCMSINTGEFQQPSILGASNLCLVAGVLLSVLFPLHFHPGKKAAPGGSRPLSWLAVCRFFLFLLGFEDPT